MRTTIKTVFLPVMIAMLLCMPMLTQVTWASAADKQDIQEPAETAGLTPTGNMTLVDTITQKKEDTSNSGGTKQKSTSVKDAEDGYQQFLTIQARDGSYFYLIIDRTSDGEENVHFLNQVDAADLAALLPEEELPDTADSYLCTCREKCAVGSTDAECAVCAMDRTKCAGTASTSAAEEGAKTPQKEQANGFPLLPLLLLLILAGGGALYRFKIKKAKSSEKTQKESGLDDDDFGDDDDEAYEYEIEEDAE